MIKKLFNKFKSWLASQPTCVILKDSEGLFFVRTIGNKFGPGRSSDKRHCTPGGAALEARNRNLVPREVPTC